MTRTWLFGEAEYESSETFQQNADRLFNTAEACGYMINSREFKDGSKIIVLDGADLENVHIIFIGNRATSIIKTQKTDRTGKMEVLSEEKLVIN